DPRWREAPGEPTLEQILAVGVGHGRPHVSIATRLHRRGRVRPGRPNAITTPAVKPMAATTPTRPSAYTKRRTSSVHQLATTQRPWVIVSIAAPSLFSRVQAARSAGSSGALGAASDAIGIWAFGRSRSRSATATIAETPTRATAKPANPSGATAAVVSIVSAGIIAKPS